MEPTDKSFVQCVLTYELSEAVTIPGGSGYFRNDFRVKVVEVETFGTRQPTAIKVYGSRLKKDGTEYAREFLENRVYGDWMGRLLQVVGYERNHTADALRRTAEAISPTVSA